jgi:hypothetical protein
LLASLRRLLNEENPGEVRKFARESESERDESITIPLFTHFYPHLVRAHTHTQSARSFILGHGHYCVWLEIIS